MSQSGGERAIKNGMQRIEKVASDGGVKGWAVTLDASAGAGYRTCSISKLVLASRGLTWHGAEPSSRHVH